jgi:3-methyladenine DNA glycosylase AlkD
MMASRTLREINACLLALADSEKAAHAAKYFQAFPGGYGEGDRFLGIRVPELRRLVRELDHATVDEATELLQSSYHEARLLALLLLVRRFERAGEAGRRRIYDHYLANTERINNWDLVDLSAHQIVGGYLEMRSRRPLNRLSRSNSVWERRIAVIATLRFIREDDFEDALAIAERLIADDHDLIHKAVGWMLREVGKRDRGVEEAFLRRHHGDMPRTMLRYAIEKFPQRLRKQYLAGAIPPG